MDPFFQFLKSNRLAREILFKPGESFTVEKVIEMSLRQDIGVDPAHSRRKRNYLLDHQIDEDTRYGYSNNSNLSLFSKDLPEINSTIEKLLTPTLIMLSITIKLTCPEKFFQVAMGK